MSAEGVGLRAMSGLAVGVMRRATGAAMMPAASNVLMSQLPPRRRKKATNKTLYTRAVEAVFGSKDDAPAPGEPGSMRATVRMHRDGVLILELVVQGAVAWDPGSSVRLHLPDGSVQEAAVARGTTAAQTLRSGVTARLRLVWSGDLPRFVEVSGHKVEVT